MDEEISSVELRRQRPTHLERCPISVSTQARSSPAAMIGCAVSKTGNVEQVAMTHFSRYDSTNLLTKILPYDHCYLRHNPFLTKFLLCEVLLRAHEMVKISISGTCPSVLSIVVTKFLFPTLQAAMRSF